MTEETGDSLSTGEEAAAAAAAEAAKLAAEGTPEEKAAAEKAAAEKAAADKAVDEGTPEEKKAAEEKAAAEKKAAEVPETYENFTLPEGMELDKAAMEAAIPVFKELGLTQDQAQKLVGLQTAQLTAAAEAQEAAWTKQNDEWRDASKADPEFGGAKLQENLSHVSRFMDGFGSDAVRTMLEETGLGNRIEMLQMFASVGKAMGEDTIKTGGAPNADRNDVGKLLYGGTTKP